MSPKEKLDLLQAEVVSYRKGFSALEKVYAQIEQGMYGPVHERAKEAIKDELDTLRNVALRYDVLLERSPVPIKEEGGMRFSDSDN
jgi:hypothetical protein